MIAMPRTYRARHLRRQNRWLLLSRVSVAAGASLVAAAASVAAMNL